MSTRLPVLLLGLATVATLASCTTPSAGEPSPESTTSAPSGTSESTEPDEDGLPSHGAPKVDNPLDVSEYEQDPCKALTQQQAQELDVPSVGPEDGLFGNACRWRKPGVEGGAVSISFFSDVNEGLSSVYEESKDFPFFEELPEIAGFPAVAYNTGTADPIGTCTVAVGVSDTLAFNTTVWLSKQNTGQKDPCDTAAMVVEIMLRNMQGE